MNTHAARVSALRVCCLVVCCLVVCCLGLSYVPVSSAAVTADHRKQIDDVKKELAKVKTMVAKKEYDDAEKLLADADQKLKDVAKGAGIDENNKLVAGLHKQIEQEREKIAKKRGGGGAPAAAGPAASFEADVAPILVTRCLSCHGADNPRANLRLDTFGGIVQGGDSGSAVVPGKPKQSLIVQRISASGELRMPKGANPLSADEIKKITSWVAGGAVFSGNNATPLADLKAAKPGVKVDNTPVQINKATGSESVSFTKDIAPWMVNLCLGCHGDNNPRSGFSVATFERLMKGGNSGRVVLPGNTKDSRLWHLVGEQDPIKMPPGQALITRTNWNNLRTWIEEGAKFDGNDPKASLRSLVPTEEEKRARELAALTPEQFAERRKEQASGLWTAAFPNESAAEFENDGFIVKGNAAEPRLKQIAEWAHSDADLLRKVFRVKEPLIWRGKLIVFVFKDRFSYTEFTKTNENVDVPAETSGHSRVSAGEGDAYLAMQDIGDNPTEESPGVRTQLMGLLAEGLLQRSTIRVPDWAARGTGLALAARGDLKNPYFRGLNAGAHDAVRSLDKPEDLFANGTFSSSDLAPVGYTLVSFMLKQGGEAYFVQFLDQLRSGKSLDEALKAVYSADRVGLAGSYIASLPSGGKSPARKPKK